MPADTAALPRWDMTVVYPGLDSPEFAAGFDAVVADIARLGELFDAEGVGRREPAPLDEATVAACRGASSTASTRPCRPCETLRAYLARLRHDRLPRRLAQARAERACSATTCG